LGERLPRRKSEEQHAEHKNFQNARAREDLFIEPETQQLREMLPHCPTHGLRLA
jgi:hypothetical protein